MDYTVFMQLVTLDNQQWLLELQEGHPNYSLRLAQLRNIILISISKSFRKSYKVDPDSLEDFTQESLIKIIEKKDTFRGESRFTSWAVRIAINLTLSELRRRKWQDISLDDLDWDKPLFDPSQMHRFFESPEKKVMRKQLVEMVNSMMNQHLTEKQNRALTLIIKYDMPLEEVARQLGTTRNALYKLLHDGRKKLKTALEASGMDQKEVSSLIMLIFQVCFL